MSILLAITIQISFPNIGPVSVKTPQPAPCRTLFRVNLTFRSGCGKNYTHRKIGILCP